MNPPPNREEKLFLQALACPVVERAALLAAACAGDRALQARVGHLLEAHDHARSFLEYPPDAGLTNTVAWVAPRPAERTGDAIGRYKLLQKIGEGGCGVVYMARENNRKNSKISNLKTHVDAVLIKGPDGALYVQAKHRATATLGGVVPFGGGGETWLRFPPVP